MNIRHIMMTDLIIAYPYTTISEAMELMKKHHVRHLPIVDKQNHLIGIVSDRDLRDAAPSIFDSENETFNHLPISDVMITDVITAMASDFVEEAAHTMIENKISCLPVEINGKLQGIISETDLLQTLVRLTGADLPTSRLEIDVANESGKLSEVSNIIREHQLNIQSVLVYTSFENTERKVLVFRIQSMNMRPLLHTLKKEGYNVIWPTNLELKA